jgi:hypothetical protein
VTHENVETLLDGLAASENRALVLETRERVKEILISLVELKGRGAGWVGIVGENWISCDRNLSRIRREVEFVTA